MAGSMPGFNFSSNTTKPGGNAPIAYAYTPNTVQLDQAVHLFRPVSRYGADRPCRLGLAALRHLRRELPLHHVLRDLGSYQLLKQRRQRLRLPMLYGELFIPYVAEGLMIRVGRYISMPDIEAQLAPNNYMYTHSMTYSFDNYTNDGLQATLAGNKNLITQFGVCVGTEAPIWH